MQDTCYTGRQKGQALLVIILVMAVVLTVGLSVASRSITNLRNTTDQAESQKAFSAAEAGIEQALQSSKTTGSDLFKGTIGDKTTSKKVNISDVAGSEILVQGGSPITQDKGADIWLVQPDAATGIIAPTSKGWPSTKAGEDGTIQVYWDKNSSGCDSAVELILLYLKGTSAMTTRYAYDCDSTRQSKNNFSSAVKVDGEKVGGTKFYWSTGAIAIPSQSGLIIRVVPLYGSTVIGAKSDADKPLPPQGKQIESTGTSGSTQRKISVFQGYPQLPQELFNGIFIIGN